MEYLQLNKLKKKLQSYILSFLFFFAEQYENACKGLHEGTENCWSPFQGVDLECQPPLGVFLRDRIVLDFFRGGEGWGGGGLGAWNISNTKYHVSEYFLRKVIFLSFSVRGKNTMFSGKNTTFLDSTGKIMSLFEKTIF